MNKKILTLLLLPFLIASCSGDGESTGTTSGSQPSGTTSSPTTSGDQSTSGTILPVDDGDEYDAWANSWSKPGHLYFHYNRGDKLGYENYCLWLWQYYPEDLEGTLWAFTANPKVSDKLTLQPMSTSWMTYKDVGKTGEGKDNDMYIDSYGAIIDVELNKAGLKGGKTGSEVSFEGAQELGFLLPQQNSMSGATNWTSDGGRENYIEGFEDQAKNWRDVSGGKAVHLFVATGALEDYSYFAGSGTAQAKTNPIDEDRTGQYASEVDTAYTNSLGVSKTSESFKELGTGYQVFVASFRDSDGDGRGDLRGIIDAMEEGFFDDLGIDVLWLTPIQKSDSYHGYDISDYYAVDKKFGTIEDYAELIYKAHHREHKIKVLMDLVLNHTSKSNRWFINSQWGLVDEAAGINWRDVYTWKYENQTIDRYNKDTGQYDKVTVKEDALSDDPSWYRDGESNYYYYGKFGSGMPEINYLSSTTRKLVIDMAKYWLSFGLDGFRLDAVKHIFMRDECFQNGDIIMTDVGSKVSYDTEKGKEVTKYYDYSSNVTKNVMWWKEFAHGVKNEYPDCFLVGENFDGYGTRTSPYYQALDSQFSFPTYYHIPAYMFTQGGTAQHFHDKQAAETYDTYAATGNVTVHLGEDQTVQVPGGRRSDFIDGPFTSNHDVMRAINQANPLAGGTLMNTVANPSITGTAEEISHAKAHAAVTLLSQGISWIYYGDELGMSSNTDQHIAKYTYENNLDIWYRQPYLWKDSAKRPNYKSGQFVFELDSYNSSKVADYETQKTDAGSMYSYYKALCEIKHLYPKAHKVEFCNSSNNVLVMKVTGKGKSLVVYINVGTGTDGYLMNPGDILKAEVENVYSLYDAPTNLGGDIGAKKNGIAVFRAK